MQWTLLIVAKDFSQGYTAQAVNTTTSLVLMELAPIILLYYSVPSAH